MQTRGACHSFCCGEAEKVSSPATSCRVTLRSRSPSSRIGPDTGEPFPDGPPDQPAFQQLMQEAAVDIAASSLDPQSGRGEVGTARCRVCLMECRLHASAWLNGCGLSQVELQRAPIAIPSRHVARAAGRPCSGRPGSGEDEVARPLLFSALSDDAFSVGLALSCLPPVAL